MMKMRWFLWVALMIMPQVASAGEFRHTNTVPSSQLSAYEMYRQTPMDDENSDPWALYMGVMVGGFGLKVDSITGLSQKNLVPGVLFQIGLHLNRYLSTELRFGSTTTGKTSYSSIKNGAITVTGKPVSVSHKVNSFITYLVKPTMPVSDSLGLYVALGGTTAQITVSDSFGTSVSKSKTGFSFGVGGNWYWSDSVRIETDVIDYWNSMAFDPTIKSSMWGLTSSINMAF